MRRIAFVDMRGSFDEFGNLKPIHELSAEQGAALAGIEVVKRNLSPDDDEVDYVHKIKLWDKGKALAAPRLPRAGALASG